MLGMLTLKTSMQSGVGIKKGETRCAKKYGEDSIKINYKIEAVCLNIVSLHISHGSAKLRHGSPFFYFGLVKIKKDKTGSKIAEVEALCSFR